MAVSNQVVGAITANGQTIGPFDTSPGIGVLRFQITGTWTGTLTFQCGIDGVVGNVKSMAVWASDTGPTVVVTTTTGNGVFSTIDATAVNVYIASTAAWTGTAVINMSIGSVGH